MVSEGSTSIPNVSPAEVFTVSSMTAPDELVIA
jgi:hypothetical protein